MSDDHVERYPDFAELFAAIPFQARREGEKKGAVPGNDRPCPLCGQVGHEDYFVYDEDFGAYLCARDYYNMYWAPESILGELPFDEEDAFLPGIDRVLLHRFVTHLLAQENQKFDHLTILEVD